MRFKDVLLVEKYLVSAFDDIWGKLPIRETFTKMIIDEKVVYPLYRGVQACNADGNNQGM